jgi:cytochrome c peroxidase
MRRAALAALALVAAAGAAAETAAPPPTAAERAAILRHGPWPPPAKIDPSNRASGRPEAVELGRRLFHDAGLSRNGAVSCASCHDAAKGFTDGRRVGRGLDEGERNTLGLADMRLRRWFGWDGAADSLWMQTIRPLLDAREMGMTAAAVARRLAAVPAYACLYEKVFGAAPASEPAERALVGAAKALAAFQETIASGRTAFDAFRDAVAAGDAAGIARYPAAARRGLALFLGRGQCAACHHGPNFTNEEFADIGLPFFLPRGADGRLRVDPGRHGGIRALKASPFSLLGRYNDDPARAPGTATAHVTLGHRNFGEFKVPSLRNLRDTAPYFHDGSRATLRDVVVHYSTVSEERLHADGERLVRPLGLAAGEIDDLVAFLETLSGGGIVSAAPAPTPCR